MFGINFSIGDDGQLRIEETKSSGKVREFKGRSANKHVDDYCVVDLETTGVFVSSADIIEISAIKVRNNEVVAEYSTLVNPECHIPAMATAVNHITDDMVKDAPVLDEVIDDFLKFVGDDVIVGYNNAGFDMNLIYDAAERLRGIKFSNDYLDMLHAVRRSLPELENAKLETASQHYGLDTVGEHRALKDCYLTKAVYDKLNEEFGDKAFKKSSHHSSGKGMQYSAETLALQELQQILQHMLEDGQITEDEVNSLRFWLEEHRDLAGNYPFDKVFDALDAVLEDGQITEAERDDLKKIFAEVVDPVKAQGSHDSITTLAGKHVCLTGEFDFGSKKEVEQLITDAGGIMDKSVKKATNYVVVGSQGSEAWKTGNYGSKIQKAMEWNAKGQDIKIIEEKDFILAVQNCLQSNDTPVDFESYKVALQNLMTEFCEEHRLFSNSVQLVKSTSKKMTGYKIQIFEEEYPSRSDIPHEKRKGVYDSFSIALIKEVDDATDAHCGSLLISVRSLMESHFGIPSDAEQTSAPEDYVGFYISPDSDELMPYLKKLMEYRLKFYRSSAGNFGCCSSFNACSDAKQCVHYNLLYSTCCMYRYLHLDKGEIFYGKNRNVD